MVPLRQSVGAALDRLRSRAGRVEPHDPSRAHLKDAPESELVRDVGEAHVVVFDEPPPEQRKNRARWSR